MKKLILTSAMLTVASMVSFAQTTPADANGAQPTAARAMPAQMPMTPEQRAQRMTQRDEKMLTLTPEQSKAVYDVELDFANSIEKMRATGKPVTPEDRNNIMTKKDAKMKAILTPEQYTKYDMTRNRPHNGPMTPATQTAPAMQSQPNK